MGGRFKREGTYVYLRLIHVDVWQKPTQYCKAITLQVKVNTSFKNRDLHVKTFKSMYKRVWLPGWVSSKESTCQCKGDTGDAGSISGSGRSTGVRNGNPLQHSCLENPVDRGAWRATVRGVAESSRTEPCCCCSVTQSCPILCDPMDCSTSPSPPAFSLSQHQDLF